MAEQRDQREIPWWGMLSASAAPVLLIGGWTVAAALQPAGFDSLRDTISDLAAAGMPHRLVMSSALVGLGVCHVVTARALRPAALPGRIVLGLGGVATVLVAANPLPSKGGESVVHTAVASAAFAALALWPAVAVRRSGDTRRQPRVVLSWRTTLSAEVVLVGSLLWLLAELRSDGARIGLAERVAAGTQALWPLAVVLGLRR